MGDATTLDEHEDEHRSAIEWWSPNDEANPHNWSTGKKIYHSILPAFVGFLCPFGSSVYTPGLKQVQTEFGVPRQVAVLPFVFYLLGLSFGPIIASPTSEQYGRRIVYMSSLPVFAAFTLGAGFSQSIASLTICRFFAGVFSSPGLSLGTGSISDVWPPQKRGAPMSLFIFMVQMGPAFGPTIGGFVVEFNANNQFEGPGAEGWRWTQWVICFGIALVFAMTLGMSETYKRKILLQRANKLGIAGPAVPDRGVWQTINLFATKTITRPLHMLFTEPIVTFWDIYTAFNFGLLNAFFAAFPYVFENVYGFDTSSVGVTFLAQAIGSFVGLIIMLCIYSFYWTKEAQKAKVKELNGKMSPDKRLIIALIGAPLIPISLFWFGWTARSSIHWLTPVAAEAFFSCGNILVFTCSSLYLTDCYGALYGASAWASNIFLRYLFSFIFPLFAVPMYQSLGVGWASSLLGFVALVLMFVPLICYRYGAAMRSKTKYVSGE